MIIPAAFNKRKVTISEFTSFSMIEKLFPAGLGKHCSEAMEFTPGIPVVDPSFTNNC
jgi:hypothetical protein